VATENMSHRAAGLVLVVDDQPAGAPTVQTAIDALEYGAFKYLFAKPSEAFPKFNW
jgi:hypothetical protein